ncbi:MAG: hypothetical protein ACFCVD_22685 [Nodosilinea sp.]
MVQAKVSGPTTSVEPQSADSDRLETVMADPAEVERGPADQIESDQIEALFKHLKTLLNTVEKLQKARLEVGDLKPLVLRLLDGELLSGEDLEELKSGVGGLAKLLRLYGDYQIALEQAQPAKAILDDVLKS